MDIIDYVVMMAACMGIAYFSWSRGYREGWSDGAASTPEGKLREEWRKKYGSRSAI